MERCRLPLAIALGALLALGVASCGAAQQGSEASPLTSVWNITSQVGGGSTDNKASDSKSGSPANKANLSSNSGSKGAVSGKPNFFSTRGNKIVDADGKEVRITGINWFGMETGTFAPHGLWSRNWEEMLDQIASLGFNTIRLPYSNQLFDPNSKTGEGVDFKLNPDLKGLSGMEVMDKIVTGAGQRGLKVILDQHRPDVKAQSKLWYSDKLPEEKWIADWVMLAQRYKGNDTVIAADLHNEPAGDSTWGSGDPKTDWRLAAEKAGNAIHEVNPDWLIIVEGIEKTDNGKDWYWMGGNLVDAAKYPVRLKLQNKLVYSAHDYGPEVYMQGWFKDPSFPSNLPSVWDSYWGYLAKEGKAPILLGEFGGKSVGEGLAGSWQRTLFKYLKENGFSYTYWAINPNSGDTGGILSEDWKTPDQDKMEVISSYQAPKMRVSDPTQVDTSAKPGQVTTPPRADEAPPIPEGKAAPEPGPNDPKIEVLYRSGRPEANTNNPSIQVKVANAGTLPVKLSDLEVRYWFDPDCENGTSQLLDVDWANIGADRVEGKFAKVRPHLEYLSLTFRDGDKELEPDGSIQVVARIHRNDWAQYDQMNDYSFSSSSEEREWKRITAYVANKLTWGVEPKL